MATIAHFLAVRLLTSGLRLVDERTVSQRRKSIERSLGFVTFLMWTSVTCVALDLVPKEHGEPNIPQEPWGLIAGLGPVVVAVLIYKLGVRLLAPREV
jgi:hypothetical protein